MNASTTSISISWARAVISLGFIASASPGSPSDAAYSYQDFDVASGQTYWYMLEDISLSGVATMHGPISVVYQQTPTVVTLSGMDHASGPGGITDLWLLAGRLVTGAFAFYRRRGSAI